jgi:hypothetical protein
MITYGYKRTRHAYTSYVPAGGSKTYILKYMKIGPRSPRGICQFALAVRGTKQVPHLFFTCPECGEINRFYISLRIIVKRSHSDVIRQCHNCRFCNEQLPFGINLPLRKIKEKYLAVASSAPA